MASNPIKISDLFVYDSSIKRAIADMEEFDRRLKALASEVKANAGKLAVDLRVQSPASQQGQEAITKAAKEAEVLAQKKATLTQKSKEVTAAMASEAQALREKNMITRLEAKAAESAEGSYNKLSAQYGLMKIQLNAMSHEQRANTEAGRKLEAQAKATYQQMDALQKATGKHQLSVGNYKIATEGLLSTLKKQQAELKAAEAQGGRNSEAYRRMRQEIAQTRDEMSNMIRAQGAMTTGLQNIWEQMKGMLLMYVGLNALFQTIKSGINDIVNFEAAMSKVAGLTLATDEQFKQLRNSAKELGATTSRTATEVAELQIEYAKLGFTTNEILASTDATIMLSQATMENLGASAEVVGATIRGFGMQASEAQRVVDVMAESLNYSALDLERFRESMKTVAPIAKVTGTSLEYTTAMLAVLSDAGIHGSMAGTALKQVFAKLTEAGKPFAQSLREVANSELDMAKAMEIMGQRNFAQLLILAENIDKIEQLDAAFQQSAGSAEKMSDIMMNNVKGAALLLKSAWEGVLLKMDGSTSIMRGMIESLTALLTWITNNAKAIGNTIKGLTLAAIAVTSYRIATRLLTAEVMASITGITAKRIGMGLLALATGRATAAANAFKLAWASAGGPISMLISLLTTVGAGWLMFRKKTDQAAEGLENISDKISREQVSLQVLSFQIGRTNTGTKERAELIKTLNAQYGQYLPYLIQESDSNNKIREAIHGANEQLRINIALKEMQREMEAAETGQLTKEREIAEAIRKTVTAAKGETLAAGAVGAFQDLLDRMAQFPELFMRVEKAISKTEGKKVLKELKALFPEKNYVELRTEWKKATNVVTEFNQAMRQYGITYEDLDLNIFEAIAGRANMDKSLTNIQEYYSRIARETLSPTAEAAKEKTPEDIAANVKLRVGVMREGLQKELAQLELDYDDKLQEFIEAGEDPTGVDKWYEFKKAEIITKYRQQNYEETRKVVKLTIDAMKDGQKKELAELEYNFEDKKRAWISAGLDITPIVTRYQEQILEIEKKYIEQSRQEYYKSEEARISRILDSYQRQRELIELEYVKTVEAGEDIFEAAAARAQALNKLDSDTAQQRYDLHMKAYDEEAALLQARFEAEKHTAEERERYTLKAERDRLQAQLDLMLKYKDAFTDTQRATVEAMLKAADAAYQEYKPQQKGTDLYSMLGLDIGDEQKQAISTSVGFAVDMINETLEAKLDAAQKEIESADERLKKAEDRLNRELEDRRAGYASNVQAAQVAVDKEEQARQQAIKRREVIEKQQARMDALRQTSSLVTASAKIWAELGALNPLLAVGAIALMWSSFAAAKLKAAELTKTVMRKGGYRKIYGGSHESGQDVTVLKTGREEIKAEGGEGMAIFSRQAVREYGPELPEIVERINKPGSRTFAQRARQEALNAYIADGSASNRLALKAVSTARITERLERVTRERDIYRVELKRESASKAAAAIVKIDNSRLESEVRAIRKQVERREFITETTHVLKYKNVTITKHV